MSDRDELQIGFGQDALLLLPVAVDNEVTDGGTQECSRQDVAREVSRV